MRSLRRYQRNLFIFLGGGGPLKKTRPKKQKEPTEPPCHLQVSLSCPWPSRAQRCQRRPCRGPRARSFGDSGGLRPSHPGSWSPKIEQLSRRNFTVLVASRKFSNPLSPQLEAFPSLPCLVGWGGGVMLLTRGYPAKTQWAR